MANKDFRVAIDVKGAIAGIERMQGSAQESFVRKMLVTGGTMFRDEAIARAPDGPRNQAPSAGRDSHATWGKLKDAIYLYYDKERSNDTNYRYTVSWNRQKAPQGQWLEFGHTFRYAFYKDKDGRYHTIKSRPLARPFEATRHPFMAPAYDARLADAQAAMLNRARAEFGNFLAGGADDDV